MQPLCCPAPLPVSPRIARLCARPKLDPHKPNAVCMCVCMCMCMCVCVPCTVPCGAHDLFLCGPAACRSAQGVLTRIRRVSAVCGVCLRDVPCCRSRRQSRSSWKWRRRITPSWCRSVDRTSLSRRMATILATRTTARRRGTGTQQQHPRWRLLACHAHACIVCVHVHVMVVFVTATCGCLQRRGL